jgi:hypothetical protein
MRKEALPLAYRRTLFRLEDIDDLIKLLLSIGDIGRTNIQSIELIWESRSDSEYSWDAVSHAEERVLDLPTLHVFRCTQLLKQCKNLRFLRLHFDSDAISIVSRGAYKDDPSIRELCSLQKVEQVELMNLSSDLLKQCELVTWLKHEMEAS